MRFFFLVCFSFVNSVSLVVIAFTLAGAWNHEMPLVAWMLLPGYSLWVYFFCLAFIAMSVIGIRAVLK